MGAPTTVLQSRSPCYARDDTMSQGAPTTVGPVDSVGSVGSKNFLL